MKSDSNSKESVGILDPSRLKAWAPHLSDSQFESTQVYLRELLRFNKTLNLISAATVARVDAVHILDTIRAWSIVESMIPAGSTILDFGSGNGLPGLLSAALAPDRQFRLVDRDQRKMEFCKITAATMGLKNLTVSVMDVADLPDSSVDFALSRGFASVTKALLLTRSLFRTGGSFFMMKGDSWSVEIAELPPRLFGGWKVAPVGKYSLPDIAAEFVVVQCLKLEDLNANRKS
jgi:16S rRNA (guanine527-N7)-methyltransferase